MEIRQSLEANFLTCRHCHQPYRNPKVLVCLHTFCQVCLEQLVTQKEAENEAKELEAAKRYYSISSSSSTNYRSDYRKKWSSKFRNRAYDPLSTSNYAASSRYSSWSSTRSKNITCPICEKETALPSGGVADLPTDHLADRLASMVDRMPTFPVCDVCTKQLLLTDGLENSDNQTSQISNSSHSVNYPQHNNKIVSHTSANRTDESDYSYSSDEDEQNGSTLKMNGTYKSTHNGYLRVMNNHQTRRRHLQSSGSTKSGQHSSQTRAVSSDRSSMDNGPRPASAACLECAKRLCVSCRDTHAKMPVTANHVLIRVEQMDELKCSRHPRELRRFFCLTCRMYICIVCTFESSADESDRGSSAGTNGHAEHEIMSIREAITTYQDQLSRDSATTQAHINQIESLLNSLQVCEMHMQKLYSAIDAGGKLVCDQLKIQQRRLKDRVDTLAGIPLEILSTECKRLNQATNDWYDFLNDDRITSRLDLMDPLEALTEAGPMLDRVNGCLRAASVPLNKEMARQPFLMHLKSAEVNALNNDDSGLVSSQSVSPVSRSDSTDAVANSRANYWRLCLGKFEPAPFVFGRIVTDKELAAEAKAEAARKVTTCVQTGPELIKALPPPKGTQRHRAVQVDLLGANLDDRGIQTDPCFVGNVKPAKVDAGTQYQSSDVNPPVSMYRSLKQILVQK